MCFGGFVEALGDAEHDGEGGSEFVADVGEEAGFGFVEFAELLVLGFEEFARAFDFGVEAVFVEAEVFVEVAAGEDEDGGDEEEVEVSEEDGEIGVGVGDGDADGVAEEAGADHGQGVAEAPA